MRSQHSEPDRAARAPRTGAPAVADRAGPRLTEPLGPGEVLHLQRSVGNAAVAHLIARQRSPVLDVVGRGGGEPLDAGVREQMEVVQQRQGPVDGTPQGEGIAVSSPSDRFERAATANADRMMARLAGSPVTVQRTEQSAALLKTLATPKIGQGQAIDVQTELVDALEALIGEKTWTYGIVPSELKLGGILVDRLPGADKSYRTTAADKPQRTGEIQAIFDQLVGGGAGAAAQFVGLDVDVTGAKIPARIGTDVKKAGLGPMVVENTLKTMIDAEQFEYLRLAGLPNDEWKILVEVHYIRARPKDMAGFHKDTQGQSLFVNLNYHVPGHELRGPEYVLNPPRSEAHDAQIYGTAETEGTLPEEFTDDLTKTREALGEPTTIESAGTVGPLGYVAFVDEAVHHATPWFGNRYVTPSEFKAYLERNHKAQLDEIVRADTKYRRSYWPDKWYPFSTYVDKTIIAEGDVDKWRTWLAMATVSEQSKARRGTKYTRREFEGTMHGDEFDLMLEDVGSQPGAARAVAGAGGWYAASIPGAGFSPVRPKNKRPLVRTASSADLTKNWPAQLPEDVPRRFIRSWVRAVPKSYADAVRDR